MNKIKNIRLFLLSSFLVALTTSLTTTILSSQIVYSEGMDIDNNIGKFFTSPALSIQQANYGLISEINSTHYLLELKDVSDKTVSFADRPDRFLESRETFDFIGNWSTLMGAHSSTYAEVPPNAALIFDDEKVIQEMLVIELYNPIYDEDKKTLNYDFTIVDDVTLDSLSLYIGHSALLIDGL
ncbi:MAG: hypothetical protein ACPKPY_09930 [Nitrososphaeraceae archaeon]